MRFLIIPGNNSLSHGLKSIAIQRRLISKGHDSLIAVSPGRAVFYEQQRASYTLLRDIQETDSSSFPTMNWFRDREKIIECIESEIALIRDYKPDRVLGVFRFTLKASAAVCGIPFDSLICGCMLPDTQDALGYYNESHDSSVDREFINMFFRSAGIKMSRAISAFDLKPIDDIREMLVGDRTFLWDIPEFMPIQDRNNYFHAGPLYWNKGVGNDLDNYSFSNGSKPLAVLAFGTCNGNIGLIERMVKILDDLGYRVVVAAGGQEKLLNGMNCDLHAETCLFAPVYKILAHASLVICHGGQMTIFEALENEVPVAVIPFHPEQAHNGICLEKIGCGRMLTPACRFIGNSAVYTDAMERIDDDQLKSMIVELVENPTTKKCLKSFKNILERYNGLETLTNYLGE